MKLKVKCIKQDQDKTLIVGEIYDVLHKYEYKVNGKAEYLLINTKGWEYWYSEDLFEVVL